MTTPGIARIVVATDFSETSELALDYARAMAGRFGASIHLLHVLDEPPALSTLSSEMFVMEITALCATRHERTRQRLQRLLTPEEGVRFCATGEVRTGRAAETIRDVAVERGADLIVMGTHGRGGVAHLLLGSVAEKVVRIASCAVLTVRPDIRRQRNGTGRSSFLSAQHDRLNPVASAASSRGSPPRCIAWQPATWVEWPAGPDVHRLSVRSPAATAGHDDRRRSARELSARRAGNHARSGSPRTVSAHGGRFRSSLLGMQLAVTPANAQETL